MTAADPVVTCHQPQRQWLALSYGTNSGNNNNNNNNNSNNNNSINNTKCSTGTVDQGQRVRHTDGLKRNHRQKSMGTPSTHINIDEIKWLKSS